MTTNIQPSLRPSYAFASAPTTHSRSYSQTRTSPIPPSTSSSFQSQFQTQPRPSYDGRTVSGKIRRLTISLEDAALARRHEFERHNSSAAGTLDETDTSHRLRPRTSSSRNSWMRRFSTAMSSRSASPAPSEAVSADPSFSTASKTFSYQSSTAPILGSRPPTAPAAPNKLVKRTASQQTGLVTLPSNTGRFALPRPATSHQRTAVLEQRSNLRDSTSSTKSSPEDSEPPSQVRWRQYFSIKVPKFVRSQKRHTNFDGNQVPRSLPDNDVNAVRSSTKSRMSTFVDDEATNMLSDHISFSGQPDPSFNSMPGIARPDHDSLNPESPVVSDSAVDASRFSIQGLLRRRSSRAGQKQQTKLVKRSTRRVFSDPLAIGGLKGVTADDERPAKRRQAANDNEVGRAVDAQQLTRQALNATSGSLSSAFAASPTTFNSGQSSPYTTSATNSPDLTQYQSHGNNVTDSTQITPKPKSKPRSYMHPSALSEPRTTLVGSEDEDLRKAIMVDDVVTDQSTLFESLRTKAPRSTTEVYHGRIETIFDNSPSPPSQSPKLRNILPDGMLTSQETRRVELPSSMEEESVMATPVRTIRSIRSDRADDGSPLAIRVKSKSIYPLHVSSPPSMQKALNLGTLEYDDEVEEEDNESRWSCFGDDSKLSLAADMEELEEQSIADMDWANSKRTSMNSTTTTSTSRGVDGKDNRKDTKNNLFDWTEQSTEKLQTDQSPPRPRTVHGSKKHVAGRGVRAAGRRIPSGLHTRSQSVPVVPGLSNKRETVMTNKFGTWGVGSKGVSEDWDEDFDFGEESPQPSTLSGGREEKRVDSGTVMHIPQTIRESQVAVVNNIGLVREFYKLIEELKVLRMRATTHDGRLQSSVPAVWDEIDAMIDLADQEVDAPLFPAQSSLPSSPAHDPDPFDDFTDTVRRPSFPNIASDPRRSRSQRQTVLPNADNDVFSTPNSKTLQSVEPSPSVISKTRPRKDSEAMARSVIEAVQRKKEPAGSDLSLQPVASDKKVPFDTNTLRHIVPYVNNLVRKVRASMNDHDFSNDFHHAPTVNENTRLSQLFNQPHNVSPTQNKSKRPEFKVGNAPRGKENHDEDISNQLNEMNLI